jgi:hypothetical protein
MAIKQRGPVRLYISHGAGSGHADPDGPQVDWFIVEPRDNPEQAAGRLRAHGRTVVQVDVEPYEGGVAIPTMGNV